MKVRVFPLILILVFSGLVFSKSTIVSHPVQKFSVVPSNEGARLTWQLDLPDTVFSYNDGYPSGVWDPHMQQALGLILDLSAYPGATLEQIDFVHWGREKIHGPYYYNILFFDMDSAKLYYRIDSLQAGDAYQYPRFEIGVPLGSVPARDHVGIFVEGLSTFDGTHAFPALMSDTSAYVPGVSYYLADVNDPFYAQSDEYTNFFELKEVANGATNLIMDVWINFGENSIAVPTDISNFDIPSNPNRPQNVYLGQAPSAVSEQALQTSDDRILEGFYIYRGSAQGDTLFQIGEVGASERTFVDPTALADSSYVYGVATYNTSSVAKQIRQTYYQPPVFDIAQAKIDANGDFVPDRLDKIISLRGTVISPNFSGHFQYFVSDGKAGIQLYASHFSMDLAVGDSIFVSGHLTQFMGMTELKVDSIELVQILGQHKPDTLKTTLDQIGESLEGQLVLVENLQISNANDWPAIGQNSDKVIVTDGTHSISLYIDKDTDLDGWTPPAGTFNLVAVVDQYTSSSPANDGYQLRPRSQDDFITATAVDQGKNPVALQFHLEPCYPNPFNPQTTIRYQIAKTSHVLLQVYNIRGQKVKTLFNGKQPAGSYKQVFTAGALPSGIYFVRLKADGFSAQQKIVLLK